MSQSAMGHRLMRQLLGPGEWRFRAQRNRLESVQRRRLSGILNQVANSLQGRSAGIQSGWCWEDFAYYQPATDYSHWRSAIERQKADPSQGIIDSRVMRYQPTSGSGDAIKWLPYTRKFLSELDSAIAPWLGDLYRRYPGIRKGTHYWSLSWLPTEMRQQVSGHINDDMKLLGAGKRWLASRTQAVPESVSLAATSDDSLFATLAYLCAREDLSALSVWSPTFALGLLEKLGFWKEELSAVLSSGRWGLRARSLRQLQAPLSFRAARMLRAWDGNTDAGFYQALWPNLALVSAWDTASAAPWARQLRSLLPHAPLQGKGLWATEGVITIPQGDQHVLAAGSHFYEFEDISTREILPSWQLEAGQQVSPLMTTGAGLLRYRLGDRLRVTGHLGQLPTLEFQGRDDSVDMVGEKLSTVAVQKVLDSMQFPAMVKPVIVLGLEQGSDNVQRSHPQYLLLAEAPEGFPPATYRHWAQHLADQLEAGLKESFHYQLARNLGQLESAQCLCGAGVRRQYMDACRKRGMIDGNIKVEALRQWSGPLPVAEKGLEQSPAMDVQL
ncbi:MAG: GH3 auxin-responsive promoter family protein [Oleiphilaceae bacterium]|nr:GH3 auxin-responsive promoter family protein [Oleiphilaceae bacterium]